MSNNPIKILHIFGGMNKGGAETLIMNVYRNIDRDQFQFDFAVGTTDPCDYDDEIVSLGGVIHPLSSTGARDIRAYWGNLNYLLRTNSYDVVHSHIYSFSGVTLYTAKKNKVPIRIAHSHSTHDGKDNTLRRNIYRTLMRKLILHNATNLLGCSTQANEALYGTDCWDDKRSQVILNGIDLSVFEGISIDQASLRKKIGIPDSGPMIGHVGRFVEQKNHSFMIEIFAELLKEMQNAQLILVGDGPLKEEIRHLAESKGIQSHVHMLGVRSDIPEIMSAMDVFLFPSLYEGLGIVLVEAQAASLPCLISDTIPQEVDMGLGLIHPLSLENDISIWVQQIKQLLTATRPNRNLSLSKIREKGYSVDSSVEKLSQIYKGII